MNYEDGYPGDAIIDEANKARDLLRVIEDAVTELDAEHAPMWSSDEMKARGKEPIGCHICFPGDGSWPCTSRMIADDLRAALK